MNWRVGAWYLCFNGQSKHRLRIIWSTMSQPYWPHGINAFVTGLSPKRALIGDHIKSEPAFRISDLRTTVSRSIFTSAKVFDRNAALATAMKLFWVKGYEATSVTDLTTASGIGPTSLYAAF